jgi:hypothetical protein
MERTIQPLSGDIDQKSPDNSVQDQGSLAEFQTPPQGSPPIKTNPSQSNPLSAIPTIQSETPSGVGSTQMQMSAVATVYTAPVADLPDTADAGSQSPLPTQYLTGSQLELEKTKLPIGIYVIQAWGVIGLVLDLFDTSQTSTYYMIAFVLDILLCVGLLFRLEVARKLLVWTLGATAILSVISFLLLSGIQQRLQTEKADFQYVVSKINQSEETLQQRQEIASLQAQVNNEDKKAGKSIDLSYFKFGATLVVDITIIVYLTRPSVKGVFRELEK